MITLCHAHRVDVHSVPENDKRVFTLTYNEFLETTNLYSIDPGYKNWKFLQRNQKLRDQLLYNCAEMSKSFYRSPNNEIPGLRDSLNRKKFEWSNILFDIVDTNAQSIDNHIVNVLFVTRPLVLIKTIGDFLLLSESIEKGTETFLIRLSDHISIISCEEIH